jgi:hypothetical protein
LFYQIILEIYIVIFCVYIYINSRKYSKFCHRCVCVCVCVCRVIIKYSQLKLPKMFKIKQFIYNCKQYFVFYCRQNYLLIPHSRVLLEHLTSFQLVKNFPSFYGTRKFIAAFTSARHLPLSWVSSIQPTPPYPIFWKSILILPSHLRLGLPSGRLTNIYFNFCHLLSKERNLVLSDWCLCHCESLSVKYFEKV